MSRGGAFYPRLNNAGKPQHIASDVLLGMVGAV